MNKYKFLCVLFMSMILSACSSLTAPVSLNNKASCEDISIDNLAKMSAEKLYETMTECLKKNKQELAFKMFTLAGLNTWYDYSLQPADYNYKRHNMLMNNSLTKLTEDEINTAWEYFSAKMKNKQFHKNICELAKKVGDSKKKTQIFDDVSWRQAMGNYLHCID